MNAPKVNTAKVRRFDDLPLSQQAGMLCNDPRFQKFAAIRCGLPNTEFNATAAAQYLRDCCRITSRRDLSENQPATLKKFQAMRTEFDAWTGKIGRPT